MPAPKRPAEPIRGVGSNQHQDKPATTTSSSASETAAGKAAGGAADSDPFLLAAENEAMTTAEGLDRNPNPWPGPGPTVDNDAAPDWADAAQYGITTDTQKQRFRQHGLQPSDVESRDRDLRFSACAARGDLVFDDKLISDAYALNRHSTHPDLQGRVMAQPRDEIHLGGFGEAHPWNKLTTRQQLAYIDGYTTVLEAAANGNPDRFQDSTPAVRDQIGGEPTPLQDSEDPAHKAREAGVRRAQQALKFQHQANNGLLDPNEPIQISHQGYQTTTVTHIEPVELPDGTPSTTDYFGRGVTGQHIRFTVDQFEGWGGF